MCLSKLHGTHISCIHPIEKHPPLHRGTDILGEAAEAGSDVGWPVFCHEVEREHIYAEFCVVCNLPSAETFEAMEELRILKEAREDERPE